MATMKKSVVITKPASLTGSIKQTNITTPTAKKLLKPDTVVKKTPIASPKATSLANKTPLKPIVSKMASTKVSAAIVDKSAVSSKPTPVKSSVSSPSKPVLAKAPIKRAVADSTSSDKESAAQPVRKLSIPTGLTKSTKVVSKPVASNLTPGAKVPIVKTKPALTDKLPTKLVAEKLPTKAKLTSSTPLKTSSPLTKPVTTSALTKRPLTSKMADMKKPVVSRPALAKSVSKTATPVVKPPSIRTPIAGKKVIKKCTEVQICDADSTSSTINDQLEMELGLEFGTVVPGETPVQFNEIQVYKVAEQMMEVLGTAVVTNEPIQQDPLLKDSVFIDMSALEVASQTVPAEQLAGTSVEAKVLEQTTDFEPAEQVDNDSPKETEEEASTPDLISFDEGVKEEESSTSEPTAEDTSEGVAEDTAVKNVADDATNEYAHDQEEVIQLSVEDQVSESDEVSFDEVAAVSGDESEPTEEMSSGEQIFEPCTEDETQEVENCKEFVDDLETSSRQCDFTCENEIEYENVHDYESCSIEAEVNNENIETEEQGEVNDEIPLTADPQITHENDEDGASFATEWQPKQPEEITEEVFDPAISINIQEDHFCVNSDRSSVIVNLECSCDDFVAGEIVEENGDEDLEQMPFIVDDCSAMDAEKFANTESFTNADSAASYAEVLKQPVIECAGDFEAIENEEVLVDLEVEEDNSTYQQMVHDSDNLSAVTVVNEEEDAVTEATKAAADTESTEAAGDAEATKAPEDGEASEAAKDVDENPVEQQIVKVEPLLGSMTDEVQQELDAGMEHSLTADEEGYAKVQKKRNKRHNKRNKKSLKAFQNDNTDFEPVTEVQETQDDLQVYQKRRNFRRAKNSMKKQFRRYSEPYSNSHCYSTPVWKSYYVEH